MNASSGIDKLDPKESLLAENVRLDEQGDVQSAGASTPQNTATYVGSTYTVGTTTFTPTNIHSLYWNPSLGAVAGIGQDVFIGPTLGGMSQSLANKNLSQQKMSFGSAYNRVYFDVSNTGYWTDETNLLTVDWPPPTESGATITGPSSPGTATQYSIGGDTPWSVATNILNTTSATPATVNLNSNIYSEYLQATMTTNSFAVGTAPVTGVSISFQALQTATGSCVFAASLMVGGSPVGTIKEFFLNPTGVDTPCSMGGSDDTWGIALSQANVNAGNFGVQLRAVTGAPAAFPNFLQVYKLQITLYQGAGIFSGTGTTGTLTGTYNWKVTFVDGQGEESDSSGPTGLTTLTSQQGTLTAISTGDARTSARNIYRTGGSLTSYYLVGTIQDNKTTTYSDNQTDLAALAEGVILAGDVPGDYPNTRFNNALMGAIGAPQGNGRFPTLHYDRIFWINPNKPNQIYWSKPLNGFAYPAVNFIDVGDGKPVTRIISIFGELIIIKTDSIWRLTGTDEPSFNLTQTPSSVGTDMPFTVVALPDKVIFANRYGLWIFNGYTSVPLTNKLDLWFKQQNRTGVSVFGVSGFQPPEVASATVPLAFEAVGNSEKYCFAYTEQGTTLSNNSALMFDVKRGNITKRSLFSGFNANYFMSLAIDPVNGFIYTGNQNGYVSLLDDWNGAKQGGNTGSVTVNLDFQTGYFDLQRGSNKSLWALEFFINTNGQSVTPFVYYDGGENFEQLAAVSTPNLQRVVRTVQATNARKMQNFSVRLNGTINPVNIVGTAQIRLVHIKALFDIRTGRARTGQ